jgi:hypothetical protein
VAYLRTNRTAQSYTASSSGTLLRTRNRSFESIGRVALLVGDDVRVEVECHRDVGVTQSLLHDLSMHPLGQEERCAGVTQIMEADHRYVGVGDVIVEAAIERVGVQVAASFAKAYPRSS